MRESTKEWLSRKLPSSIRNLRYLIHAIRSEDEDYIDNVITQDVYINGNYFGDGTPLHVAARIGNYKIFKKLIKIGADMNKRDPTTQETVLDSAMKSSNSSNNIVRYLKENGVEKYDRIKRTALQFAADEGTREVMTLLLLTNKADINAKSDDEIIPNINAAKANAKAALIKYVLDLFCIYEGDCNTKTIFHAAADIDNHTILKNWLISFSQNLDFKINNEFFCTLKVI